MWYPGLVALGGAALIGGPHHPWRLLAAWLAPTAGWLGGHYLGDYFDRQLDAIGKPHRPIPSGRLNPNVARICGCGCFTLLAVLAILGGLATTGTAVLGALGIVGYSRWLKARGVAGNLIRGTLGALALLYGAAAIGQHPAGRLWPALLVLAIGWLLHDTSSNLVGAIRDVEGDRAGGYRTLPVRHGSERAVRVAIGLYAGAFGAMLVGGLLAGRGNRPVFGLTMLLVAVLAALAFSPLVKHRSAMAVPVALRAHSVLVIERVILAAGVLGLGLGAGWQIGLAVPIVGLTWWTQAVMRTRHELGSAQPATVQPAGPVSMEEVS
jgi:4-hydroxybenzoate polyprenyltransferase/geranylgeranylglycerol-phosphate geranylgeranyltransferase